MPPLDSQQHTPSVKNRLVDMAFFCCESIYHLPGGLYFISCLAILDIISDMVSKCYAACGIPFNLSR